MPGALVACLVKGAKMYNNIDNLRVGEDYYDLSSGEYKFTVLFLGDEDDRLHVEGVPLEVKPYWTDDYMLTTWAYNKETMEPIQEDAIYDYCYNNVMVSKERLDEINTAKQVLMNLWEESGIQEPFVYEDGKFSVGKEQVLSAHINAGYEHGWISSSICW